MSLALKLMLAPLLLAQALGTRRRAPVLPEAAGARSGRVGHGGDALRVLIAGDSSAAGVGVAHQRQALAGQLSRALRARSQRPVHWSLHARTGLNTLQVFELLRTASPSAADVAVIVSGVNDLTGLVSARRAIRQRALLADWLLGEGRAAHVVFATLPPLHRFPLLPQPLRRVLGADAQRHDAALAHWAAARDHVSHTAISYELGPEHMAEDGFHPGEAVYRACGEALAAHIAALPALRGR